MTAEGSLDIDTLTPVWTAGWQWPWAVVLALVLGGNFLLAADRPLLGTAVLVGGPLLAGAGVRAVSAESATLRRAGTEQIRAAAVEILGDEARGAALFTLSGGTGSVVGLDAAKRYETTVLAVGSESISLHDGEVNLLGTSWRLDETTASVSCDRLDAVAYTDGAVEFALTDGTSLTYASDDRPTAALTALAATCPDTTVE